MLRVHTGVLHTMRSLGISMATWSHDESETTARAGEVCTQCNYFMCDLLELSPHELHCCLKVFSTTDDAVYTWMRSEPYDNRYDEDIKPNLVIKNSVWSALLGSYDGKFKSR